MAIRLRYRTLSIRWSHSSGDRKFLYTYARGLCADKVIMRPVQPTESYTFARGSCRASVKKNTPRQLSKLVYFKASHGTGRPTICL